MITQPASVIAANYTGTLIKIDPRVDRVVISFLFYKRLSVYHGVSDSISSNF